MTTSIRDLPKVKVWVRDPRVEGGGYWATRYKRPEDPKKLRTISYTTLLSISKTLTNTLEEVKKKTEKFYSSEKIKKDIVAGISYDEQVKKIATAFLRAWKEVCGNYILLFRGIKLTRKGYEFRTYQWSKYYPWTLHPLVAFRFARDPVYGMKGLIPAIRVVKARVKDITPDIIATVPFTIDYDSEADTYRLKLEYDEMELGFKTRIPPYEDYRILKVGKRTTGKLPKAEKNVFDILKSLFELFTPKKFHGLIRVLVWVKDRRFPTGGYWSHRWVKPSEYRKMKWKKEKVVKHPLTSSEEAMLAVSKQKLGEYNPEDYKKEGIPEDRAPNWYLNGFPPKEAKEWIDAGFDDPYEAYDWKVQGYSAHDASRWRRFGFPESANRWKVLGFEPEEAKEWDKAGLSPAAALVWKKEGYRPEDVARRKRKEQIQRKFWFAD